MLLKILKLRPSKNYCCRMRGLFLLFFLTLFTSTFHGQILKTTNLDLNSGGIIYDVDYVPLIDCYVVVGSFTSIGTGVDQVSGLSNIAFINKSDFKVNLTYSTSPYAKADDDVYSVEVFADQFYNPILHTTIYRNHVMIGGRFNTIDTQARGKFAKLLLTRQAGSSSVSMALNSWNPDFDQGSTTTYVNDLLIKGDTLIAAGNFLSSNTDYRPGLLALSIASGTLFTNYLNNATYYANGYNSLLLLNNELYVTANNSSDARIGKVLVDGQFDPSVSYQIFPGASNLYYNMVPFNDTMIHVINGWKFSYGVSEDESRLYSINTGKYYDGADPYLPKNIPVQSIKYKNYLILGSGATPYLASYKIDTIGSTSWNTFSQAPALPNWDGQVTTGISGDVHNQFSIKDNYLFVSDLNMTSAGGSSRAGLAVYCLEPDDPKDFIVFDTTICPGNQIIYTIPQANMANGYRWVYTGAGASYRVAGNPSLPFNALTDVSIVSDTANSIEIKFDQNTTAGTLSVYPMVECNQGLNDFVYAKSKSLNLTLAPLPNISVVLDTMSFTCVRDTLLLIAQSTTPAVTYAWDYNTLPVSINDTLTIDTSMIITDSSYYYVTVTEPVNQCQSYDSIFVYYNTYPDSINVNNIVSTPAVFDCATDSLYLSLSITGATIGWDLSSNATVPSMSSFTIYDANDSLTVYAYSTNNTNGCVAKQQFGITVDQTPLVGTIQGYSNFSTAAIIDSLSCSADSLQLICDIVPANGNGYAQWVSNPPINDTLLLTSVDSMGMNALFHTNTYQFITVNNNNSCVDTLNATVKFNFDKPYVSVYSGPSSLNCSDTNLVLVHQLTGGNVQEGWIDTTGNQTFNDSLGISTIGNYYYQVVSLDNGCLNEDTVSVIQTTELLLDLKPDTLICPGQNVNVTVTPINNIDQTSYTWSNGGNTQTTSVTGGVDSLVSVIAQTVSGCTGYDTIAVLITPPVNATFNTFAGCTNGAIDVASVSGGAGSYEYSLDQTNWQTTTSFTGLGYGTYTIYVRDLLSCVYNFSATVSSSSTGPDVNFLASTYNTQGDTIAIVNISDFTGFDSSVWVLPSIADVISEADSMVITSILTGGWYDVTLMAYLDSCGYSYTEPVYFGEENPQFTVDYDEKGIQSMNVYPNPTTGNFTLEVVFGVKQNYSVVITSISGQPMSGMSVNGLGLDFTQNFTFPGSAVTGSYLIHVISDYDAKQIVIILN